MIFGLGGLNMLIPGWNFIAIPLIWWWAVEDFDDYDGERLSRDL